MTGQELHLAADEQHNAGDHSLPLSKEEANGDLHAHRHEEQAHEQALVGGNVTLHLKGKLCLSNQKPSLQCTQSCVDAYYECCTGDMARPFASSMYLV